MQFGPKTQWDLTIAIIVLQGLNGGTALFSKWWGVDLALAVAVGLGIAGNLLMFMVTGVWRPTQKG